MGFSTNLKLNDKLALNYWIVNGTNQGEPTNGFKDELFGFVVTPNKNVTWTTNYYFGQENPDRTVTNNCGPVPVQPGLCFQPIVPAPNGKLHIFDSYVNWQATPKLLLALEGDYVIQRLWATAAPGHSSAPHIPPAEPLTSNISSIRSTPWELAQNISPIAEVSSAE
jgi:hypothetical protein